MSAARLHKLMRVLGTKNLIYSQTTQNLPIACVLALGVWMDHERANTVMSIINHRQVQLRRTLAALSTYWHVQLASPTSALWDVSFSIMRRAHNRKRNKQRIEDCNCNRVVTILS